MKNLSRLLKPKSVALIGGKWAKNVYTQLIKSNFRGEIWPIHPSLDMLGNHKCFRDISSLPSSPDATFIGVNRFKTVDIVKELNTADAGGAICFASGFSESDEFDKISEGKRLQNELKLKSGNLAILGPNCYGFVNYLDSISLWPDQHGGKKVESGVAIVTQSSNIAINLTMQQRSLPIAFVLTVGNQAKIGMAELVDILLEDPRISAVGLYIEGFGNVAAFESVARKAFTYKKPIVALKAGKSAEAVKSTFSHTASITGSRETGSAFLHRLNCIEVSSLSNLLETLKICHFFGDLKGSKIASVSCSGGEASLIADQSFQTALSYVPFKKTTEKKLKAILGLGVTISNPLDYQTFVWGDKVRMTQAFTEVVKNPFDLVIFVLDVPRTDICDDSSFQCAIEAIMKTSKATNKKIAVVSSIAESMPESLASTFIESGVLPLCGLDDAIIAVDNSIRLGRFYKNKAKKSSEKSYFEAMVEDKKINLIDEQKSKELLSAYKLNVPNSIKADSKEKAAKLIETYPLRYPLVVKALNVAHKTEMNLVETNIRNEQELNEAMSRILQNSKNILVEEMITDLVAELSISIIHDEIGLFLLSIAAGGTLTELFPSRVNMILPVSDDELYVAVDSLDIAPLLNGYRNNAAANKEKLISAIKSITCYVKDNLTNISEIEINPLIVGTKGSVAADILLTQREPEER